MVEVERVDAVLSDHVVGFRIDDFRLGWRRQGQQAHSGGTRRERIKVELVMERRGQHSRGLRGTGSFLHNPPLTSDRIIGLKKRAAKPF